MNEFKKLELSTGLVLYVIVLAKFACGLLVRTDDNRYLLISNKVLNISRE